MTNIGIDLISSYIPQYALDLVELAQARGVDPDKYTIGIGQNQQAVLPADQDTVSLAANAAQPILDQLTLAEIETIDLLIFASETGVDHSKSGANFLQELLPLGDSIRAIELKQACYAGTAGLMMAKEYLANHPGRRALVVASDVARYGLESSGEVTQGAGAVAMLVSESPRLATINNDSVYMSQSINDFWRPLHRPEALVDGKLSNETYLSFLKQLWEKYLDVQQNFSAHLFHLPYTKLGTKGLNALLELHSEWDKELLQQRLTAAQALTRQVGNIYTGSLYLSLLSLLMNDDSLNAQDRIMMYSYGSGAQGELFSLTLQPDYQSAILGDITTQIANRQQLSVTEYEKMYRLAIEQQYGTTDVQAALQTSVGQHRFVGIQNQIRQYE